MGKRVVLIERLAELPELAHTADYHPHAMAVVLNVTLRSLERECRDCFAISPAELLSELWLMEAKRLLKEELAKQVFDKVGCKWMPDFSRKFKAAAGATITQWQESSDEESTDATAKLFTLLSRNANSEKLLSKLVGVKRTSTQGTRKRTTTTKAPLHS